MYVCIYIYKILFTLNYERVMNFLRYDLLSFLLYYTRYTIFSDRYKSVLGVGGLLRERITSY